MGGFLANRVRMLWEALERHKVDRKDADFRPDLGLLTEILDALPDYIWICDASAGETVYISLACEKLLGVPRDDLIGDCRKLLKRVHEADRHNVLRARQGAMTGEYQQTYRIVRPDGEIRWIQDRGFGVPGRDGAPTRIAGIAVDITERKAIEEELARMAYFDGLTRLPNRTLFYDRLAQSLVRARRNDWTVAVLFVDVDHFKHVNDTAGHYAGDELLREIGHRLSTCVRGEDTVARLGGDEFAILLSKLTAATDAGRVAEKVMSELSAGVQVGEREFSMSASIGIAIYPRDGADDHALMRNADAAMYAAKQHGRNTYRFHGGRAGLL
jgi:diguanylate cyclase (GGDEF)-like protein/PAS domain S-box-containing protein